MKKFRSISCCVAIGLFLSGCSNRTNIETDRTFASPHPGQTANVRTSADVVKLETSPMPKLIGSGEVNVILSISPGYHVNANPATFDYLIATELTADKSEGLTFGKPVYPPAIKQKFQFAEEPLAVYERDVQIKLPVTASGGAAKGNRTLALHLRVQACDEEKCFPPATLNTNAAVELK
jgi:hypothetical protein